jgi:hypothetical protein
MSSEIGSAYTTERDRGALSDESWTPSSAHAVVLALLSAEWDKWPRLNEIGDRRTVDAADLHDAVGNDLRFALLWQFRGGLLQWIPQDTDWYQVSALRERHFHQLRAINFSDWNNPADENELEKVAVRKPLALQGAVSAMDPPILWGHDRDGPFTILEGNHRMTALAASERQRAATALSVYVGLSPGLCRWHRPDREALIQQGWPAQFV